MTNDKQHMGHYKHLLSRHWHEALVYCLVFTSFGMCVGFLGPTLWDLGCQTGTPLPTMMWIFLAQSAFLLIGSAVAGLVVNSLTPHLVLIVGAVGIACTLALIPFARSVTVLATILAFMGLSMGLVDTTANVCMIHLFRLDVSPFLQALHFCYALGALTAPLIAEPFLNTFDCSSLIDNSTLDSPLERSILRREKTDALEDSNRTLPDTLHQAQALLHISDAFWIMVALQAPVLFAILSLVLRGRWWPGRPLAGKSDAKAAGADRTQSSMEVSHDYSGVWRVCCAQSTGSFMLVVLFGGALMFFADGMQAAYGAYVYTFGDSEVPGLNSAFLNVAFWAAFALGRFMAIFAALFVPPGLLLAVDCVGACSGMMCMLLSPHTGWIVYVGTCVFGLALSNVSPSAIALVEQFVDIGPSATSVLVVGATIGEAIFPIAVGNVITRLGPIEFLVCGAVSSVAMVAAFIGLTFAGVYELWKKHEWCDGDRPVSPYVSWLRAGGRSASPAAYEHMDVDANEPSATLADKEQTSDYGTVQ